MSQSIVWKNTLHRVVMQCLDVALIGFSLAVLLVPSMRIGVYRQGFFILLVVHATDGIVRAWRMGLFNHSVGQMHARFAAGERVTTGPLDRIGTTLGLFALFVAMFS